MNFLHNNWIRKISAASFLALLIFIHAVKTFHTHAYFYSAASSHNKDASVVTTNYFCSICDFKLAKDSDAHVPGLHLESPVAYVSSFYHYTLSQAFSLSIVFSVRGPPPIA